MNAPRPATLARRPGAKQMLGWALGLLLLVLLLRELPLAALPQALGRIGWPAGLCALLALVLSYTLRAARMQVVMAGGLLPGRAVWRVMLLHNAAINLLPMRGGELVFPWLARRELGQSTARSVAALMWMRVQDLAVLAGLAVLAWPGFGVGARVGLAALWLGGVLALRPLAGWALAALLPAAGAGLGGSAPSTGRLLRFAQALRSALEEGHHHHPLAWLCTAGNWLVKVAAGAWMIAAAAQTPLALGWTGAVGAELTAILPVQGPGGIGTYEAGVLAGMAWLGGLGLNGTPREAVLGAMCWHALLLAASVGGGLLAGWAHLRRDIDADPPPAAG